MFQDRVDAGKQLATLLEHYRGSDAVVLGLPRGGVPVAAEVARELGLPLDIIGVRKLGVPGQEELAMGAIGEGGVRVFNQALADSLGVTAAQVAEVEAREHQELDTRLALFRQGRPKLELSGKVALIVDDGLATGSTARVACTVARARGASRVVLAVPVAPADEAESFDAADEIVVADSTDRFFGVGAHYRDFSQTTNEEVVELLSSGRGEVG